ncbi:MAG TPA: vitamin K epoxide reductase family protein, partial [Candidatus Babeliales bacterium]|nr:vitamin K epoxide reductase family protein [Candidatus Babeliales bacterium]
KPIKSPLGKLFGISNTIVGMLFYPSIALLALVGWNGFVFIGSFGAFIVSLYLAYILFFQIRALCMICIATYFINAVLLVVSAITVFKN